MSKQLCRIFVALFVALCWCCGSEAFAATENLKFKLRDKTRKSILAPGDLLGVENSADNYRIWYTTVDDVKNYAFADAVDIIVDAPLAYDTDTHHLHFTITEQAEDPAFSEMSPGDLIASRASGDWFYKSSTGGFVLTGVYTADQPTYSLNLTITGASGADKMTGNGIDYTGSTIITGLNDSTYELVGVPDTGRSVACTGDVTGTAPNYLIDMSALPNKSATCTFSEVSTTNLVTNGTFTGSATGWTYSDPDAGGYTNNAFAVTASDANSYLYVIQAGLALTQGTTYHYSFDVTAVAGGCNWFGMYNGTSRITTSAWINSTGTYTGTFTADDSGSIRFMFDGAAAGMSATIDNVQVWE